ncbi:MAG: hypothetical protein IJ681_02085 [Bacteroidales bacterium]|nr:hypothetical protein [Bacteroidales bacterium]
MGHYYDVNVVTDAGEEIILNVYGMSVWDAEFEAQKMVENGQVGTISNIVVSSIAHAWPEDWEEQ